jgi:DNA adenine methylase
MYINELRVFEAFSGYGSQSLALKNIGVNYKVVAISEIDKDAIRAYEVIHGTANNLGDISEINLEDIPDHDLYTYSFPCTDEEDEIERVRKWYVHVMQSFSGHCDSWTHSKNVSRRGMSQATSKYLGNIEKNLPDAVERLRTVQIENMDCIDLIHKYDTPDTLFYLDPPYVHSTRKESARFAYNYEMIDSQHNKLVDILLNVKGNAILSGYDNEIYDKLLEEGWFRISLGEFKERSTKTIETTKQKREEILWVNFKVN